MSPKAIDPDPSNYSGRLAKSIRTTRERKGLTVQQVIERMEKAGWPVALQTFYGWENRKRQVNWDALPALAKALKVKIRDLLPAK